MAAVCERWYSRDEFERAVPVHVALATLNGLQSFAHLHRVPADEVAA